jgi:hypothetical protein
MLPQIAALLVGSAFAAIVLTGFAATLDLAQHGGYEYAAIEPFAAAGVVRLPDQMSALALPCRHLCEL